MVVVAYDVAPTLISHQRVQVLEAKKELQGQLEGLHMANEERSRELERVRGAPVATTPVEPAKPVTPEPEQTNAGSRTSADDFKADIEAEASNFATCGRQSDIFRGKCSLGITITYCTKLVGRQKTNGVRGGGKSVG